ncbi:hypothetical protein PYCCODRAFT_1468792 [Trametes coccinea BRFM310]|uniref:Uncharacterized protein n=1 Tax=Trametes coccinea (strain BRFM310) TaxID=1353009 RepID=A0A1Y2IJR4_TRAC3|nr:hypothetical protein PYCCODRAFT_1468792 [Trametes coccinea BRFM310]
MPPVFSSLSNHFDFTFVCVPASECATEQVAARRRDQLRAALRKAMDDDLERLTALEGAHMSWTRKRYVKLVVLRYGYFLDGWPADVPFVNLSDLLGGMAPLERLYKLWMDGILRFVPATPELLALAVKDPLRVPPREPSDMSVEHDTVAVPAAEGIVVSPLALHPGTLDVLGTHPTSTQPSRMVKHGKRARHQRRDVKKARARPVTNPEGRPLRRAKLGVKSARCVLDGDDTADGKFWAVEDPLGELHWV